jgi:hypothetical protein
MASGNIPTRFGSSRVFRSAQFDQDMWELAAPRRVLPTDIPATGEVLRRAEEVLAAFRRRRKQLSRTDA